MLNWSPQGFYPVRCSPAAPESRTVRVAAPLGPVPAILIVVDVGEGEVGGGWPTEP
jgi:hypothetical protein